MTLKLRALSLSAALCVAAALLPASASALTFDSLQNGGFTNATNVVITYSDPGGLNGANCILDASGPVTCSNSSAPLGDLPEGVHSLTVNGVVLVDSPPCIAPIPPPTGGCAAWTKVGNPVSASMSFTVDRTAPVVTLSGGPAEGSSSLATAASFSIDPGDGAVACTLDAAAVACGSTLDLTGLSPGAHQVVVSSTDAAGNVGTASRNFTVTAPAPPAATGPPPAAATPATPAILSAPKSSRLSKKIKLKLSCPSGCTIKVAFKRRGEKTLKTSITITPGAASTSFKIPSKLQKKLVKSLKAKRKVTATFTPVGGKSRSVRITS